MGWRENKREYMRAYSVTPETRARKRAWYAANKHRLPKQKLTDEQRARKREYMKKWVAANRDKLRSYHRQYNETYVLSEERRKRKRQKRTEWGQRNPLHDIAKNARRRAAEGYFTHMDIHAIWVKQSGKCAYCEVSPPKFHIDHIIPISRGGSNWPSNLQLLCPPCNLRKHNKLPEEMAA